MDAFDTENDARECEHLLSLRYGITTLPFVARPGGSTRGLVHDQARLDRIHAQAGGAERARLLMDEIGLDPEQPHYLPQTSAGRRRNLILTLFADRRGDTPMHRVSMSGNDDGGRQAVVAAGLRPRAYKRNAANWRYESSFRAFSQLEDVRARLAAQMPLTLLRKANLLGKALTLRPAAQVRPGMVLAGADGRHHAVVAVEQVDCAATVHDINVAGTHNFFFFFVLSNN